MRVLVAAPQPYYAERGTPIAVRLLAKSLAEMGHDVDLLVYGYGTDPSDPGVRVLRSARLPGVSEIPIGFSAKKLLADVPFSLRLLWLNVRRRYDVIHAVEEAIYPALFAGAIRRSQVVYDMDSSLADQLAASGGLRRRLKPLFSWLERFAIRRSAQVVAVCDELVVEARSVKSDADVHALYDVPNIEADVDASEVDDLRSASPSDQTLALYVGNLERYQGIDLLLESLVPLALKSSLSVVIVGGSDAHIAYYREKACDLGVDARVRFVGPRPLEHLGALLAQADILLSPRITGGNTPMKLYSYMASGKAILATDLSTHTQVLDETSAFLTQPEAKAYAEGLERLVENPETRERLGNAAQQLVNQKYSLSNFLATLDGLYQRLQGLPSPTESSAS